MMNREQIKLQSFPNSCSQMKAVIREAEEEADIQCHLQKSFPVLLDPLKMLKVVTWLRITKFIGGGIKVIVDIPMSNMSFPDWLQMNGTDFKTVDLRQYLPIRYTKKLPLSHGTLWTVTKFL